MDSLFSSSESEAEALKKMAVYFDVSTSKPPCLFPVFNCLSLEVASCLSCNLSLEMAKRNQTVSVIDFGLRRPNIRYLMGNLVDLQDDFPAENAYHLDFKIENIKLYGFSKITLFSLAVSGEQIDKIIGRIFADQRVMESDVVLINSPNGPDDLPMSDPAIQFQRALFLMDSQIRSLLKTYSWIKKFSSVCQKHLIGSVSQPGEETMSRQNIARLEKVIPRYLPIDFNTLITDIPLDQETISSIKSRTPLALTASPSASGQAISNLCENLLRNK